MVQAKTGWATPAARAQAGATGSAAGAKGEDADKSFKSTAEVKEEDDRNDFIGHLRKNKLPPLSFTMSDHRKHPEYQKYKALREAAKKPSVPVAATPGEPIVKTGM